MAKLRVLIACYESDLPRVEEAISHLLPNEFIVVVECDPCIIRSRLQTDTWDVLVSRTLLPPSDVFELAQTLREHSGGDAGVILIASVEPSGGYERYWPAVVDSYLTRDPDPWQVAFSIEQFRWRTIRPQQP